MPWINDETYRKKSYTPLQTNSNPNYTEYLRIKNAIIDAIRKYGEEPYHAELPHFTGGDEEEWFAMCPMTDYPNSDADVDKLEVIFRVEWYNYLVKFITKLIRIATARRFIQVSLSHTIPTEKHIYDYIRQDWGNAYNLICDCTYDKTIGERRWVFPRTKLVDRWGQEYYWYWSQSSQSWVRGIWNNDAGLTTDYVITVTDGIEYYLFPDGTRIRKLIT